jgi:hypothetical protein
MLPCLTNSCPLDDDAMLLENTSKIVTARVTPLGWMPDFRFRYVGSHFPLWSLQLKYYMHWTYHIHLYALTHSHVSLQQSRR